MRVLYITNKPIYPKIDGGCVAMENFLQTLLFSNTEVEHISFSTKKHPFENSNYPDEIQKKVPCSSIDIDTEICVVKLFKSLLAKSSYNIDRFQSPEMVEAIQKRVTAKEFDCIILDSLYSTANLDDIKSFFKGRIFVRTHNVESDIWEDYTKHEKNPFKKIILRKLTRNLKQYEIKTLRKADGILGITSDDLLRFSEFGIPTKSTVISVSIPLCNLPNDYESNTIFHIGSMNWKPNEEAVKRLIQLFPSIHEKTQTQLHIAGSHFPKNFQTHENVLLHGFVEDIFQFAIEKGILITPILSGSGIRIKILEMMSAGIPIITTTKGAMGITCLEDHCLVIADTNSKIIKKSIELIQNKEKRREIGQKARSYIQNNHAIEKINQQLIAFIR